MIKFIIFIFIILVIIAAFYNGLIVREYSIVDEKIIKDIKIVMLTDLHSYSHGKNQSKLMEKIDRLEADIIFLVGDIVDDKREKIGALDLFEQLRGYKTFYVSGNHEVRTKELENIKRDVRSYGIEVLEENYKTLDINGNNILIAGIDDPLYYTKSKALDDFEIAILNSFKNIEDEKYSILLCHRPEIVEIYNKLNFDLVLNGHGHGGQVIIPYLINGLFTPNEGILPKYAGGLYRHKNYNQIVSRGLSFNLSRPRIFNPPEIVYIELKNRRLYY